MRQRLGTGIGRRRHNNFEACLLRVKSPWSEARFKAGQNAPAATPTAPRSVAVCGLSSMISHVHPCRRSAARWQLSICLTISGVPRVRPVGRLDPSLSERYDCARNATSRPNSPAARTCQHVAISVVVPAHQVGLDGVLTQQHRHRVVDVSRCNVTMRLHSFQSLNQPLFECVDHLMFHMLPPARFCKA
jgi:hypothetical protein